MVVVAIVAVLVTLLLPAVQSARESARRASCGNNLRQLALGCQSHVTALGHYPTGGWDATTVGTAGVGDDWRQPGGWGFTLLPYIEQMNVYNSASPSTATPVPTFACPSRRGSSFGPGANVMTDYAGNRGSWASSPATPTVSDTDRDTTFGMPAAAGTLPVTQTNAATAASLLNTVQVVPVSGSSVATGGIIFVGSSLPPVRIRDGAANTYLFGEKYVPQAFYSSGGIGYQNSAYVGDSPDTLRGGHRLPESDATPWTSTQQGAFGGAHPGSFNAVFCDGSVRSIDFTIDAQTHFLLAAREDRQPVRPPD
jgi:prepilin-type processing-associated H-X9-DG protein